MSGGDNERVELVLTNDHPCKKVPTPAGCYPACETARGRAAATRARAKEVAERVWFFVGKGENVGHEGCDALVHRASSFASIGTTCYAIRVEGASALHHEMNLCPTLPRLWVFVAFLWLA